MTCAVRWRPSAQWGRRSTTGSSTSRKSSHRYHHQIVVDAERLSVLVDDLFELSRIHSGVAVGGDDRASLADVVADAVVGARAAAELKGVFLVDRVGDLPEIDVSAGELSRVLHNLIDNAIRHTPSGGTVVLETCMTGLVRTCRCSMSAAVFPPRISIGCSASPFAATSPCQGRRWWRSRADDRTGFGRGERRLDRGRERGARLPVHRAAPGTYVTATTDAVALDEVAESSSRRPLAGRLLIAWIVALVGVRLWGLWVVDHARGDLFLARCPCSVSGVGWSPTDSSCPSRLPWLRARCCRSSPRRGRGGGSSPRLR